MTTLRDLLRDRPVGPRDYGARALLLIIRELDAVAAMLADEPDDYRAGREASARIRAVIGGP